MNRLEAALKHRNELEDNAGFFTMVFGSRELRKAEVEITKAKYEVSGQLEEKIEKLTEELSVLHAEYSKTRDSISSRKSQLGIFWILDNDPVLKDLVDKKKSLEKDLSDIRVVLEDTEEALYIICGEYWGPLLAGTVGLGVLIALGMSVDIGVGIDSDGRTGFDNTQPGR